MKTTVFEIDTSRGDFTLGNDKSEFTLDLLPAYAIEFCTLSVNGLTFANSPDNFTVVGNKIRWEGKGYALDHESGLSLTIHYHGIRDYSLLFPRVPDVTLRTRLGEFYYEAEICLENNTRLSFCVMSASIFEGLLHSVYPSIFNFKPKIDKAELDGRISPADASIIDAARELRNLVHAGKHAEPFVTHLQMMDVRTTLDHIIKSF